MNQVFKFTKGRVDVDMCSGRLKCQKFIFLGSCMVPNCVVFFFFHHFCNDF